MKKVEYLKWGGLAIITVLMFFSFVLFSISASAAGMSQNDLDKTVIYASKKYGVPLPFLVAVMKTESGFNIQALSPKGAVGLMQVMPETGRELDMNIKSPPSNIIAGAKYLHYCLKRFGYEPVPALACYNAGPDSVRTVYRKNRRKFIIPPYRQTEIYILLVYKYYNYYRKLSR